MSCENLLIAHSANRSDKKIQSLEEHCTNVAIRLADTLEPVGLSEMGRFIGLMHDVGKAQDDWQTYIRDPQGATKHPGHSQFGRIVLNKELFPLEDGGEKDDEYRYTIVQVIYSHHSALHDDVDFDDMGFSLLEQWRADAEAEAFQDKAVLQKAISNGSSTLDELRQLFVSGYTEYSQIVDDIFKRNERYPKVKRETARRFELNLLNALLLSALMDADWLDTQNHEDGIYRPEIHKKVDWFRYTVPLERYLAGFAEDTDMNRKRAEVSQACFSAAISDGSCSAQKLSVFCGGGKTLASTRYALNHAGKHGKRHVFYIIPFTSIIEQNAAVLRKACGIAEGDGGERSELLEHHCNAGLNPDATVDDVCDNDGEFARKGISRYDMPLIMTTQVRFLESLFSKDKKSRRLFADYIDSEIIFDEFQAMPMKLIDMFYIAVEFMVHVMKCNVVLCSATQAISAQYDLSECGFLTGIDWNRKYADDLKRAEFIDRSAYSNPTSPVRDLGSIGDLVFEELEEKDSVLIIANTRKQARALYFNLCETDSDTEIFHLSTNMYPRHRASVLRELISALEDDRRVVCVSTSLIEAGVDVSFGSVIRYLNGFDSVVQGGGRCNRHCNGELGHVFIVNEPSDSNFAKQQHATGTVIGTYGQNLTDKINDGLALYYSDYISRLGNEDTGFPYTVLGNVSYKTTLVELWGENSQYASHHPSGDFFAPHGVLPEHRSMVRTAQAAFEVIGQNGRDVVVCLDEHCRQWLDVYVGAETYRELILAQQMLQQYTVSLAFGDYKEISNWLSRYDNRILGCNLEVLEHAEAYDSACGIKPVQDEDLIF